MKVVIDANEVNTLWKAFRNGDRVAFEKIYKLYAKDLLHYGYKLKPDRSLVEDSIQDLFVELWRSRSNLSHTSSIKFYLFKAIRYKIARNTNALNTVDIDSMDAVDQKGEGTFHLSHENYLIESEYQRLQLSHIKNVIERLPRRQQEAITLRYYHNFSNEEIADIMEVNYQSACKFIYSALKNLKSNLKILFHH